MKNILNLEKLLFVSLIFFTIISYFIGFIKKSMWKNKIYFEIIIEDGVLGKVII